MIAHRPRNADAARRTLGLESGRHIHYVAVDIEPIWNDIADVDVDAEADRLIGREVAIMGGHLLLHLHRATHCSVNALENDKQGVTCGIDEPSAMLGDRWVNQSAPESAEPFQCSDIIQSNQAAVANHVGMEDGDQLPPS